ncbi:MAG TPA: DUF192 domain-containing protein [Acidimicrobiales bacterium]|nr:DUF192 domain-containing protein [Acidimicrobiales bacterium]
MRQVWLLRDGDVLASTDVAECLAERTRGLFGRSDDQAALLLPGTRSIHTAGVSHPVDAAFLDRDLTVLATVRLNPWRVALPRPGARSVLASSAGSFERWRLSPGDRLEIRETS